VLDRFAAVDATSAGALAQTESPEIDAALFAARRALSLRPEERSILRALLMTGTTGRNHELADLAAAIRARVIDRWTEMIGSSADPAGPRPRLGGRERDLRQPRHDRRRNRPGRGGDPPTRPPARQQVRDETGLLVPPPDA
jgi:hypothetical protein